ncbi:MAG: hypothetical protein HUJ16_12715 [Kangiella sp.]|nr:hypothetical protein [Kangiella sp.]
MVNQLALLEKLSTSTKFSDASFEELKKLGFTEELAQAILDKNSDKITELLGGNNNVSVILAIGDDDQVDQVVNYKKIA